MRSKSDALKILNNIAKINNKPLLADDAVEEWDEEHIKNELDQRKYTIIDLFRFKSLRFPTIILMLTHCFIQLFYWGTGYALPSLGLNVYLNLCFFGVAELIFYLASGKKFNLFKLIFFRNLHEKVQKKDFFHLDWISLHNTIFGFLLYGNSRFLSRQHLCDQNF